MPWRPLPRRPDGLPPKVGNLATAAAAGISVPPTVWAPAAEAAGAGPPVGAGPGAVILRSASPTEDLAGSSQAGQFHSEVVDDPHDRALFENALAAVVGSLPRDAAGRPLGCVFAQPFRRPDRAGIAFFDGFYFEQTSALGGNAELTSGQARGDVVRGHLQRGDAWSDWLASVHRAFADWDVLDIEYVETGGDYELLQARPAAFPVRRNPTLSLANHREILGPAPSPWIVSVVVEAGRDATEFFAEADPSVRTFLEPYAVPLLGRAWMNFAFFFRLMDHWGLPRTWVTEGVGGEARGPADGGLFWPRLLRSFVPLVRLQWQSWRTVLRARRGLDELTRRVGAAGTLPELFGANVFGMALALRTNFALGGMLSGAARVRGALGVRGRPRVVTAEMMREYDELRRVPAAARETALDSWLERYGHRGPLESDPRQPHFDELRESLQADLEREAATNGAASEAGSDSFLFTLERRREWFRNELMRSWRELRRRLLTEGQALADRGVLVAADDVFDLTAADVRGDESTLTEKAAANRSAAMAAHLIAVPLTASKDAIVAASRDAEATAVGRDSNELRGIGLGGLEFRGTVRRAERVQDALADPDLGPTSVLVVTALEPSWSLVFGRVGAVVAEIGGELSHASILLREAGRPAVVNCAGAWAALADGDEVIVDPTGDRVTRVAP